MSYINLSSHRSGRKRRDLHLSSQWKFKHPSKFNESLYVQKFVYVCDLTNLYPPKVYPRTCTCTCCECKIVRMVVGVSGCSNHANPDLCVLQGTSRCIGPSCWFVFILFSRLFCTMILQHIAQTKFLPIQSVLFLQLHLLSLAHVRYPRGAIITVILIRSRAFIY